MDARFAYPKRPFALSSRLMDSTDSTPDTAPYADKLNLPRPIRVAVERCRRTIGDLEFEDPARRDRRPAWRLLSRRARREAGALVPV
jgi:hypothetical protein